MFRLSLITPPTDEPLGLEEAKQHLRITSTAEDDQIERLVRSARERFESLTSRQLINATWEVSFSAFPARYDEPIELPIAPLQSVTSITYLDENGAPQVWSASLYEVKAFTGPLALPGYVLPIVGESYPTPRRSHPHAVVIRFVAGYGTVETSVPQEIKNRLKELVGQEYEHREPVIVGESVNEVPWTLRAALEQFRVDVTP